MSTRTSSSRRARRRLLLTVPVAVGLIVAGAGAASADLRDLSLAVGLPDAGFAGDGEVYTVRTDDGVVQTIDEKRFGLPRIDGEKARFGAAVLPGEDLNHDWAADLVVGVPGTPDGTDDPTGHVDLIFGSAGGFVSAAAIRLPGPAEPGDQVGAALALGEWDNWDYNDLGRKRPLWVGAPGRDVGGQVDAGAVLRYEVSALGAVTYLDTITEDSPGVPGRAEAGDRFGGVLAHGGFAGIPGKDFGALKDVGTVLALNDKPILDWNQDSPGVGGTAEAGDRFGAAVASRHYGIGLVVGAPGEDVGAARDAGLVQTFTRSAGGLVPWKSYTQNSPGVPGTAETGDRFGAAVTSGYFKIVRLYVVVGAPGEDVGAAKDAGAVTAIRTPTGTDSGETELDVPILSLRQGKGLPGSAETGDTTGAALGMIACDDPEDLVDSLMIGVPGEDIGTEPDRGMVVLDAVAEGGGFLGSKMSSNKGPGGAHGRFGSILP